MRILLIEDSRVQVAYLTELLTREGHDVIAVTTGYDGLVCCEMKRPDLILLDLVLPGGMSGEKFLEIHRALTSQEGAKQIPVIITTAADPEQLAGLRERSADLSPFSVLHKPFEPADLLRRIAESQTRA